MLITSRAQSLQKYDPLLLQTKMLPHAKNKQDDIQSRKPTQNMYIISSKEKISPGSNFFFSNTKHYAHIKVKSDTDHIKII